MKKENTRLNTIKRIIWDYEISPREIYDCLMGKVEKINHFTRESLFIRLLERVSWYEILEILPIQIIKDMLTDNVIKKIRIQSMRNKYEYVRRFLHNEIIPFSRWNSKDNKGFEFAVLSNRRYGS